MRRAAEVFNTRWFTDSCSLAAALIIWLVVLIAAALLVVVRGGGVDVWVDVEDDVEKKEEEK